ncbi:transglycosylase SLT domain-containing protein [Cytophagaceae bacterium ABcell3]|nr:transglycosylase SLT domain-containing protein [Cytophagaceae bacterium ABcell3]
MKIKQIVPGFMMMMAAFTQPLFVSNAIAQSEQEPEYFAVWEDEVPVVSDELIIDRLGCLEKDIKLTYNDKIRSFIDYFTIRNRNYMVEMERRKNLYFPIFEEYLEKHEMPDELKYLAIVESGLNPKAISRAGAGGLWQFMPTTGKHYKLKQDAFIDERFDPYKATEAACVYLKDLYRIFGDWELALASYNCGPGNVRRAIRRSGYKDTFWGIYNFLPKETRGYVPQFVAVTYAMNHLKDHNIFADSLEYPMYYDTLLVSKTIDVEVLAEQLDVCPEDILKLNPSIKRNIIPEEWNLVLRIPADRMDFLAENREVIMGSSVVKDMKKIQLAIAAEQAAAMPTKRVYTVRPGDNLGKIAMQYKVSVADLKRWNNIKSTTIYSGQKLTVYSNSTGQAPTLASNNGKSGKSHVYLVQPGDTLWAISRNNNIPIERLKQINNLKSNNLKVGMKLVIG